MKRNIFSAALLALAIIVPGCSDDEEDKGSFKVTLDGPEKEVVVTGATLTISDGTGTNSRGSHSLRIEGMIDEDMISVGISNWDFQEPPDNALLTKEYYNIFSELDDLAVGEQTETCMRTSSNTQVCEGTLINFFQGDKVFSSYSSEAVVITLTKCDGKRVSGTFDITLISPHNESEHIVLSGSLTDLRYVIERK